MKKMTDLLVYELDRIKYGYLLLIGMVAGLQVSAIVNYTRNRLNQLESFQRNMQGNILDFLETWGPITYIDISQHTFYYFSIFTSIICLLLYAVAIWYRDWMGKNNLSYRLLSLPGSRMNIFFAKLLTILLMIAGLLACQLLFMVLGDELLRLVSPTELYQATSVMETIQTNSFIFIVLPPSLLDFLLHYLLGIAGLTTLFTIIVLELSFKWKGVFIGVLAVAFGISLFIVLYRMGAFKFFFPIEMVLLVILISIIVILATLLISKKLLQNKISV